MSLACRAGKFALAAALFVAFVESLKVAVAWWRDGRVPAEWWEWLGVAALPVLVLIWARHFSIFGSKEPQCLLPEEPPGRPGFPREPGSGR